MCLKIKHSFVVYFTETWISYFLGSGLIESPSSDDSVSSSSLLLRSTISYCISLSNRAFLSRDAFSSFRWVFFKVCWKISFSWKITHKIHKINKFVNDNDVIFKGTHIDQKSQFSFHFFILFLVIRFGQTSFIKRFFVGHHLWAPRTLCNNKKNNINTMVNINIKYKKTYSILPF